MAPFYADKADELTAYLDLSDESVYGVRSGKLKVAYEATFNVLDKIAFFLNYYLQLGIPDKDVSLRSIWKDHRKTIRPALLAHPSKYLRALYELAKELPSVEHFGVFTDIRNLLTHRYFDCLRSQYRVQESGGEIALREARKLSSERFGTSRI